MSYTLDDVHEALALAVWHMPRLIIECTDAELIIHEALDAIEAQLPEPCPDCGSDECGDMPAGNTISFHCPARLKRVGIW